MAKNYNLAFDYGKYNEENEQSVRSIRHKKNARSAADRKKSVATVAGIILLLALLSAMIFGKVEISSLYAQRTELQTQLEEVQNENVSLESELAQKTNMTKVEEYAENELGLQKLDKSQIEYVEVDADNVAKIVQSDDSNIFVKIKRWFNSALEYIGL